MRNDRRERSLESDPKERLPGRYNGRAWNRWENIQRRTALAGSLLLTEQTRAVSRGKRSSDAVVPR